ncbi:MAG: molybdopterin-guanine dinucleotide biosynthesis protein MobB [Bacillota bacterium]|nr:molybdopterin-guanine dinucleotide biosynthesis protein MobB [Bacillota bacterium]
MRTSTRPMRAFSVTGVSKSGKTTLVVELTKELTKRGYKVGTIKSIGCGRGCENHVDDTCDGDFENKDCFTIDTKGKNTYKHRKAGAQVVTAWSKAETAIIYPKRLELAKIIDSYDYDFLIVEGGRSYPLPKITTGTTLADLDLRIRNTSLAISGRVADQIKEYKGLKAYRTFEDVEALADLIEEKVYPAIAFKDYQGCRMCGMTCEDLVEKIHQGEKTYKDCLRAYPKIDFAGNEEDLEKLRKALIALDIEDFPGEIKIEFK